MNKTKHLIFAVALLFFGFSTIPAQQKAAAPYKITKITMTPFDQADGKFQNEITPNDERSFFNEISLSMLVAVEVTGEAGTFETGRQVEIVVLEGKRQKAKKTEQIGLIGGEGKFYIPVWLDSALCDKVTVTARIIGQKIPSTMKRQATFACGE